MVCPTKHTDTHIWLTTATTMAGVSFQIFRGAPTRACTCTSSMEDGISTNAPGALLFPNESSIFGTWCLSIKSLLGIVGSNYIFLHANNIVFLHGYERGWHFIEPLWKINNLEFLFLLGLFSSHLFYIFLIFSTIFYYSSVTIPRK